MTEDQKLMAGLKQDPVQRVLTAWHETGHAVAYMHYGLSFRYVTLHPRAPDVLGLVAVRSRRIDRRTAAVITCAGPVAELRYAGLQRLEADDITVDDVDVGTLLNLVHLGAFPAEMATAATPYQSIQRSCGVAVELVRDNWDAVGRIATALLSAPRALTYLQCVELAHPKHH